MTRRPFYILFPTISLASIVCIGGGCARPRPQPPSVDPATLNDESFQAFLAEETLVTNDELFRTMLILADGQDTCKTFEERQAKLEERGIVRPVWHLERDNVADCGSAAYMVCKICHISGGVDMHLFGAIGIGDRRYALRELEYRDMIGDVVDYQYITGPQLFAVVRKADELMRKKGLYESTGVDLTDEKDRDEQGNLIVPSVGGGSSTSQPAGWPDNEPTMPVEPPEEKFEDSEQL